MGFVSSRKDIQGLLDLNQCRLWLQECPALLVASPNSMGTPKKRLVEMPPSVHHRIPLPSIGGGTSQGIQNSDPKEKKSCKKFCILSTYSKIEDTNISPNYARTPTLKLETCAGNLGTPNQFCQNCFFCDAAGLSGKFLSNLIFIHFKHLF